MKRIGIVLSALMLTACCTTPKFIPTSQPVTAEPHLNPTPPKSEADTLSNIHQLTTTFARAGEAYFSHDMRWVIFQAAPKPEDQYQMYIAKLKRDATGEITGIESPTRITPENSRNTCGWFSPDDKSLIFASTAGKEDPSEITPGYQRQTSTYRWSYPKGMEIFRYDNWQSAVNRAGPGGTVNLATHALTNNDFYDAECDISPDGRSIVFSSNRTGDLELWSMRTDGSHLHQLTNVKGYDGGPFFSPDGKQLVYRSDRHLNDLLQIFVADIVRDWRGDVVGLTNEKQLTSGVQVNWGPYWHPDGKHILFANSGTDHTNYEIYMVRSDGTRLTRMTFSPGADVLPVVSPDGKYLLWASKRTENKTVQIFIAHLKLPPGS
jgi:TolB protein